MRINNKNKCSTDDAYKQYQKCSTDDAYKQ